MMIAANSMCTEIEVSVRILVLLSRVLLDFDGGYWTRCGELSFLRQRQNARRLVGNWGHESVWFRAFLTL
jgi:hypothetical protein